MTVSGRLFMENWWPMSETAADKAKSAWWPMSDSLRVIAQKDGVTGLGLRGAGTHVARSFNAGSSSGGQAVIVSPAVLSLRLNEVMSLLGWSLDTSTVPEDGVIGNVAEGRFHGEVCHEEHPSLLWPEFLEHLLRQGWIIEVRLGGGLQRHSDLSRFLQGHLGRYTRDYKFGEIPVENGQFNYRLFFSKHCHPQAADDEVLQRPADRLEALLNNPQPKLYETCYEALWAPDDGRPQIGIYKLYSSGNYRLMIGEPPPSAQSGEWPTKIKGGRLVSGHARSGWGGYQDYKTYQQAENELINIVKGQWVRFSYGNLGCFPGSPFGFKPKTRRVGNRTDFLSAEIVSRAETLSIVKTVVDTTTIPQKTEWSIEGLPRRNQGGHSDYPPHYKAMEAKDNVIRYALGLPLKPPSPPPKYIDYSKKHVPDAPTVAAWNQKVRELKDAYNIVAA